MKKPGFYSNIAAKKKRISQSSGEEMRKPGTSIAEAFKDSEKTAKKSLISRGK
tara:strand:+ start:247 stop:405 length:159 start_codon:yes stop_codon:yes gene_type:complete